MTPERWQQLKQLMLAAAARDAVTREAFLERVCAEDPSLRQRVEKLLAADRAAAHFLEEPALRIDIPAGVGEPTRRWVGPFKIERELGRGGMGTVYLARRKAGEYRTRVAVKVLHLGLVHDDLARRFRNEGHILARLEHPHIARLLDGGTTDDGLPYLVMEYIEGQPIDLYCRTHGLTIPARLELFLRVCAAVEFAHRNMIVHRDLKPSNILVTAEGDPKLLDFGIAKLLRPGLLPQPIEATATAIRLMTPEYASPEQVCGDAITTSTDVYSLGLVLYTLLTDRAPYHRHYRRMEDLLRAICELDPPRPSSAVGNTATEDRWKDAFSTGLRSAGTRQLRRQLKGDLDAIVMRALRKEPEQRYRSVERLADDIERHRLGLPIDARRGSMAYQLGRLLRRHALAAAATALFIVMILTFAFSTASQRHRIAMQRDRAEEISEFLIGMFEASDPYHHRPSTPPTTRDLLERGAARVHEELGDQPELQAALMNTLGRVYLHLGAFDAARPLLEEALSLRRSRLDPRDVDMATSLELLGELLCATARFEEAEALFREALEIRRQHLSSTDLEIASSLSNLARAVAQRDPVAAEQLLRQAVEIQRRAPTPEHLALADGLLALARVTSMNQDHKAAENLTREASALFVQALGEQHAEVARARHQLAKVLERRGEYEEAETLHREVLDMRREILGQRHPDVAESLYNLAVVTRRRGNYDEAESLYREALAINLELNGEEHPNVAAVMRNLARLLHIKGDLTEAEALFRRALAIDRKIYGPEHPNVAADLERLAALLQTRGQPDAAEELLREALSQREKLLGPNHFHVAVGLNSLAHLLASTAAPEAAEPLYRRSLAILEEQFGDQHPDVASVVDNLAILLASRLGRHEEAEKLARRALAVRRNLLRPDHPHIARSLATLALALEGRGDATGAESAAREALDLFAATTLPDDRSRRALAQSIVGSRLATLGRFEDAEQRLLESHALTIDDQVSNPWSTARVLDRLVVLYDLWGKPERATSYRQLRNTLLAAQPHHRVDPHRPLPRQIGRRGADQSEQRPSDTLTATTPPSTCSRKGGRDDKGGRLRRLRDIASSSPNTSMWPSAWTRALFPYS